MMEMQERRRSRDFAVPPAVFVLFCFIREVFFFVVVIVALSFVCLLNLFCFFSYGTQHG